MKRLAWVILGSIGFLYGAQENSGAKKKIYLGVEVFSPAVIYRVARKKAPLKIGLITNQTGQDQHGDRTLDILRAKGFMVKRIFVPEHGFHGSIRAGDEVKNSCDAETGIPIISLFNNRVKRAFKQHIFNGLDLIIFDMQECGMRHYTYISTLFYGMKTLVQLHVPLIVFDRPSILGGQIEGPLVDNSLRSFISVASIPLRYGLTIGELARYFNQQYFNSQVTLHVVKMRNFVRAYGLPGALQVSLSPYITDKESCFGYSFLGVLGEVAPFDTGLDTPYAMRCIALSEKIECTKKNWEILAEKLKKIGLTTVPVRYKSPRKKNWCYGLRFVFSDTANFSSFEAICAILSHMRMAGVPLRFSRTFDKAVGTPAVRAYASGKLSASALKQKINSHLMPFLSQAAPALLYTPAPHVQKLFEA